MKEHIPEALKARALREQVRRATSSGRVFPSVVLAGVQKGGTTSLYHQLRVHPNVMWIPGKGTHYFDLHYHRGVDWFRSRFPHRLELRLRELRTPGKVITAESCGYYFDHPLAPARCAETLPNARVVIMLRNPVARAYSHYHDSVGKGFEKLSFEEAIDKEDQRLAGEAERIVSDPFYHSDSHHYQSYCSRGIYVDHVRRWIEQFSEDQVLVVHSEAFYKNMASEYARVVRFLELPEWNPPQFESRNVGRYPEIAPETRALLVEYFAPHNRRLYDYLGVDYGWS